MSFLTPKEIKALKGFNNHILIAIPSQEVLDKLFEGCPVLYKHLPKHAYDRMHIRLTRNAVKFKDWTDDPDNIGHCEKEYYIKEGYKCPIVSVDQFLKMQERMTNV